MLLSHICVIINCTQRNYKCVSNVSFANVVPSTLVQNTNDVVHVVMARVGINESTNLVRPVNMHVDHRINAKECAQWYPNYLGRACSH